MNLRVLQHIEKRGTESYQGIMKESDIIWRKSSDRGQKRQEVEKRFGERLVRGGVSRWSSPFSLILIVTCFFVFGVKAVKCKHYSINMTSTPWNNHCCDPVGQRSHKTREPRDKQNAPRSRIFLLEPSQSQPPQALRCPTQPGLH